MQQASFGISEWFGDVSANVVAAEDSMVVANPQVNEPGLASAAVSFAVSITYALQLSLLFLLQKQASPKSAYRVSKEQHKLLSSPI